MKKEPPEGAEWRWVNRRLGLTYNFVRNVLMWSWRWGPFIAIRDYRRASQHGVYLFGRFYGHTRRVDGA